MKKPYKNNRFKTPTSKENFELPDVSFSVSNIQGCYENINKKTSNNE